MRERAWRGWRMYWYFSIGRGYDGVIEKGEDSYRYDRYESEQRLIDDMIEDINRLEGIPTLKGKPMLEGT